MIPIQSLLVTPTKLRNWRQLEYILTSTCYVTNDYNESIEIFVRKY